MNWKFSYYEFWFVEMIDYIKFGFIVFDNVFKKNELKIFKVFVIDRICGNLWR